MPKKIPEQELSAILAIVADHPEGVQVAAIRDGLAFDLPPRMLQRRLALLVEQKRVLAEGRGKGRRYRLPSGGVIVDVPAGKLVITGYAPLVEVYVPLSPQGEALKQTVRQPIQNRQPVGYHQEFLTEYRPNETFYLSRELRQKLAAMGQSFDQERPAGTHARQIYNRLLIDLSWNSSRLEGNTYSLLETQLLLEMGESAEGRTAQEAQMILNHKAAIELLVEQSGESGISRHMVLGLHALLSENLLDDPGASGRLRTKIVGISGSTYHPLATPQLIEQYFGNLLDSVAAIADPFEQAFFLLVHLPYLQPFDDVNKRVSRLAANISLIRANLSPLSFVDVPERAYVDGLLAVYELNRVQLLRDVFVWAYERSCARYAAVAQTVGEPDPFRLRHRSALVDAVATVVREGMSKRRAATYLLQYASEHLLTHDQKRFVEIAETELMYLHEGSIARYKLRPSEYRAWRETWK